MRAVLAAIALLASVSASHAQSIEETVAFMLNGEASAKTSAGKADVDIPFNKLVIHMHYAIDGCKVMATMDDVPGMPKQAKQIEVDFSKVYSYGAKPWKSSLFGDFVAFQVDLQGRDGYYCSRGLENPSVCDKSELGHQVALFPPKTNSQEAEKRLNAAFAYFRESFCKGSAF